MGNIRVWGFLELSLRACSENEKSSCRTSELEEGYEMLRRNSPAMSGCQVFETP